MPNLINLIVTTDNIIKQLRPVLGATQPSLQLRWRSWRSKESRQVWSERCRIWCLWLLEPSISHRGTLLYSLMRRRKPELHRSEQSETKHKNSMRLRCPHQCSTCFKIIFFEHRRWTVRLVQKSGKLRLCETGGFGNISYAASAVAELRCYSKNPCDVFNVGWHRSSGLSSEIHRLPQTRKTFWKFLDAKFPSCVCWLLDIRSFVYSST